MGIKKGIPDLSLFFRNCHGHPTFCWAELKSETGRKTEEQEGYLDKCTDRGGYTSTVRSLEDLKRLLERAQYYYSDEVARKDLFVAPEGNHKLRQF
jgi:hypothetical protein